MSSASMLREVSHDLGAVGRDARGADEQVHDEEVLALSCRTENITSLRLEKRFFDRIPAAFWSRPSAVPTRILEVVDRVLPGEPGQIGPLPE